MKSNERPVVITGCGLLTPLGAGVADVFKALLDRRSATSLRAPFDTAVFHSRVVGALPEGTDLTVGMRKDQVKYFKKNVKVMCRDIQIACGSVGAAVADAGLELGDLAKDPILPTIDHTRFGIIYGAGFTPVELEEMSAIVAVSRDGRGGMDMAKWGREGIPLMFPLWLLKYLPNMLACHVGIIWDCQGPSNSITCNDASGLLAIGEAFRHLARRASDIVLCGAAESRVHPSALLRQHLLGQASTNYNDRPEAAHRPFDADRDGLVCAEGSGTLVMESADHAAKRGRAPLAEVAGFGSSCAITKVNVVDASGQSVARAIRAALRDADLKAADIDAVVARGLAVVDQDIGEALAIRETLGDVPVTAFSGGMGNIGAGHGIVDAGLACRMMAEGLVPAITNCERLDPRCPIKAVVGAPLKKNLKTVLVLSAAIAGQTGALILRKL